MKHITPGKAGIYQCKVSIVERQRRCKSNNTSQRCIKRSFPLDSRNSQGKRLNIVRSINWSQSRTLCKFCNLKNIKCNRNRKLAWAGELFGFPLWWRGQIELFGRWLWLDSGILLGFEFLRLKICKVRGVVNFKNYLA